MPSPPVNLPKLHKKLMTAQGGIEAHRLVARLLKATADRPQDALPILADYSRHGPIPHCRTHTMAQIFERVPEGDLSWRSFFEWGLSDSHTAYWSAAGLIRVSGRDSYPQLLAIAENPSQDFSLRAHAARLLGLHSGQRFICGLPTDPGHWPIEKFPASELRAWASAGYPTGPGFAAPHPHPSLQRPETPIELAASRLEAKLAKQRATDQDPVNPTNWLIPAAIEDLAAIQAKWRLPEHYLEFLTKFSPLRVSIESRRYYQNLTLYSAADLIAYQTGFATVHLEAGNANPWPEHYLVIADHALDPFVLDLSRPTSREAFLDAPVLTAMHGMGTHETATWEFSLENRSFLSFLERLA